MANTEFYIGYTPDNDNLVEFTNQSDAELKSEEWCLIEARTADEAMGKYEECFLAWKEGKN